MQPRRPSTAVTAAAATFLAYGIARAMLEHPAREGMAVVLGSAWALAAAAHAIALAIARRAAREADRQLAARRLGAQRAPPGRKKAC